MHNKVVVIHRAPENIIALFGETPIDYIGKKGKARHKLKHSELWQVEFEGDLSCSFHPTEMKVIHRRSYGTVQ